jgi:hypothetical protein
LPILKISNFHLPSAGLFSAFAAFGFSYLLLNYTKGSLIANYTNSLALSSKHLPLWSNKNLAVNPDRAFF